MEWVETTGKTVEEARERALEELGVAEDDAEVEVLDEPKAGLFGLIRGEARVRARVRPAEVRPKVDRRRGRRKEPRNGENDAASVAVEDEGGSGAAEQGAAEASDGSGNGRGAARSARRRDESADDRSEAREGRDEERDRDAAVDPAAVGAAAVSFMEGLVEAFDLDATVELEVDGSELDVRLQGQEVGLLIGPGGRTLLAVQDLARVAAQRRLGDHDTRLRIDVAGYRERRRVALERFARSVAEQVVESGRPRSLEPMPSADRKVIHDVLVGIDGVTSHSEGDDPDRRVVVTPA